MHSDISIKELIQHACLCFLIFFLTFLLTVKYIATLIINCFTVVVEIMLKNNDAM